MCCLAQDVAWTHACRPQIANSGVTVRFAELGTGAVTNERMVHIGGWSGPAEHTRQANLPSGRGKQVLPPYHQIYILIQVVHCHRELVGPVAQSVLEQHVSALGMRILLLFSEQHVGELLHPGVDRHSEATSFLPRQIPVAATT